jgi:hypothetical protein
VTVQVVLRAKHDIALGRYGLQMKRIGKRLRIRA